MEDTPVEIRVLTEQETKDVCKFLSGTTTSGLVELVIEKTVLDESTSPETLVQLQNLADETSIDIYASEDINTTKCISANSFYLRRENNWVEVQDENQRYISRESINDPADHSDTGPLSNVPELSQYLCDSLALTSQERVRKKLVQQVSESSTSTNALLKAVCIVVSKERGYVDNIVRATAKFLDKKPSASIAEVNRLREKGVISVSERELAPGDVRLEVKYCKELSSSSENDS